MARTSLYKKAAVLVEATYTTDRKAADVHGVSLRSVENWRVELISNPDLVELYQDLIRERSKRWLTKVPELLESAVTFLDRSTKEADPTDPEVINAVTNSMSVLAELLMLSEMMAARMAKAGTKGAKTAYDPNLRNTKNR